MISKAKTLRDTSLFAMRELILGWPMSTGWPFAFSLAGCALLACGGGGASTPDGGVRPTDGGATLDLSWHDASPAADAAALEAADRDGTAAESPTADGSAPRDGSADRVADGAGGEGGAFSMQQLWGRTWILYLRKGEHLVYVEAEDVGRVPAAGQPFPDGFTFLREEGLRDPWVDL